MEHSKRNFCNNVLLQQSKQYWLMTIKFNFFQIFLPCNLPSKNWEQTRSYCNLYIFNVQTV